MSEEVQHQTALDSDDQQVGALYGRALLGAAGNDVDHIVWELESIVKECLDAHPNLESAFASPRISVENKEQMLGNIFGGRVHPTLLNFLKVLCRRGRLGSLRSIQVVATQLRQEQTGKLQVIVTSALPLSDDQRNEITEKLRQTQGKEPVLIEQVDSSLMGGIVIRIGDKVIDGSVQGKLAAIGGQVAARVHEAVRDKFDTLTSS